MDNQAQQSGLISIIVRGLIGGTLMGLANLVPGISGGTMLLAAGIYPLFIGAIADLSTLKFRAPSMAVLGAVVLSAGVSILFLAGLVKDLVVDHRWVMYSLFIGLTLGGLPVVWKITRPATRATWIAAVIGFIGMSLLAILQSTGITGGGAGAAGMLALFIAGILGAGAMILPGVSGGYLLLVLGQYVTILGAIETFKNALQDRAWSAAIDVSLHVLIPVGVGVVIGIVGVSNLLKFLLRKYEKATLGVLLGLLVGAVVGLWPFQMAVQPDVGDVIKGQVVTVESLATIDQDDWPTEFFKPTPVQVASAVGLVLLGFALTTLLAKIDPENKSG